MRPPGGREGHFGLKTIHWIVFAGKPAVLAHGGAARLDSVPSGICGWRLSRSGRPTSVGTDAIQMEYARHTDNIHLPVLDSTCESAPIPPLDG